MASGSESVKPTNTKSRQAESVKPKRIQKP